MHAGRLAGDDFAQIVQLMIEYAPEPPYATGSPGPVCSRSRWAGG
ncbi:hypothetical protein ACWGH5_15190 [Streptomyces sp. NPDC054864]